ncbi:MAG: hypothetical protein K2M06_01055 [Muribaculaceae bacterium]|nr:hypothetical protein [Muribaculaceae bacterium]
MFPSEWHHSYILTAGESDAGGRMPVTLVTERVIEAATEHANALHIGYDELSKANIGWVLSRLAVEMFRYPRINERYTLSTWIQSYNRRFSERAFVMKSDDTGEVLGYMLSIWTAIDIERRTVADLSAFEKERFPIGSIECPIAPVIRPAKIDPALAQTEQYTFKYCDLDFNRHVNTVRYITLILNHWSLDWFDTHTIRRFDILFHHECFFGQTVDLCIQPTGSAEDTCEINHGDQKAVAAHILWSPLTPDGPDGGKNP